jgi:hypothetical protein
MIANDFDIGAHLKALIACQHTAAVAGGSGDNAYIVGDTIDLASFAQRPVSALLIAPFEAALAENKTLTIKSKVEHDTASNMGTAVVYAYDGAETTGDVVATGGTGGSTEKGVYTRAVDLSGVNRYFRFSVHQDLNATGTDTNQLMAVVVFAPAGVVTPND